MHLRAILQLKPGQAAALTAYVADVRAGRFPASAPTIAKTSDDAAATDLPSDAA